MPYLILENAAGFILFTQKVFGAKETLKIMRDENVQACGNNDWQ